MKIHLLSDIHIEFEDFSYQATDSDVVVLAGDIHVKEKGVKWAIETIKDRPVIYVPGNHEFYGKAYPKHLSSLKDVCEGTNIHLLENERLTIDGVNFLGCTLWTDFEIYGDPRLAGARCQEIMTDYKKIRLSPKYSKLRSIDVSSIHRQSLQWLENELGTLAGNKNVVVTHHGPSEKSVPEEYIGDIVTSAYVSNLESTILKYAPDLWLHGHLHNSSSYTIGDCQVICNPKGYPDEPNSDFNPTLVIDI